MFYSGVKTNHKSGIACLGDTYFTSSTVTDFKQRFIESTDDFIWHVEYFKTPIEAFDAERRFHHKFDVANRRDFYNAVNSSGSACGAGSVLCKSEAGEVYRVSSNEYATGNHKHVCASRMLVYVNEDTHLTSINKADYDPEIHRTQFNDHVLCVDTETNTNVRIPKDVFNENRNRYKGITSGVVYAYNKITHEKHCLTTDEYNKKKDLYEVKCRAKTVKVFDKSTNKWISVTHKEYDKNKERYIHRNKFHVYVYELSSKEYKTVTTEAYTKDRYAFVRAPNKHSKIFKIDDSVFASRKLVDDYLLQTYDTNTKWWSLEKLMKSITGLRCMTISEHKKEM